MIKYRVHYLESESGWEQITTQKKKLVRLMNNVGMSIWRKIKLQVITFDQLILEQYKYE